MIEVNLVLFIATVIIAIIGGYGIGVGSSFERGLRTGYWMAAAEDLPEFKKSK